MSRKLMLLLAFLSVGMLHAQMTEEQTVLVSVAPVVMSKSIETRRYTGLVVSPATVNVVTRVSGDLCELGFQEGDFVKEGQLLYRLDDIRYSAQVKNAEAKVTELRARVVYSKNNYNRINELFGKDVTTRDEMENALSEYDATQASFAAAESSLVLAKDDLKNTRIYAAINGKIGATNYTVGNYITPNSGVLATIVQLDPIRLKFSISNRDFLQMFGNADKLSRTGKVKIVLADDSIYSFNGEPVYGTLDFIDNSANRTTDTVQLYFKFPNADYILIPQSTVKVILEKDDNEMFASIPPNAVMVSGGQPYVYIVNENGVVERRDIELGNISGSVQLVHAGLNPGERVITEGVHKVAPGSSVQVIEK